MSSVDDIKNPSERAKLYAHVRGSHGEKRALSERMRAERKVAAPDTVSADDLIAPPKGAYPLPADHPIFLRGAELGIDVLSDRAFKIVASTYRKGLYTEDEIDCFVTTPSGKPQVIRWDIVDEARVPEWARARFFYPSGKRRKKAAAGLPLPQLGPGESEEGVVAETAEDAYFRKPVERLVEELVPWDTSSFMQTLFVPGLAGQVEVYKRRFLPLMRESDAIITLGGMLRLAPFLELGVNADDEHKYLSPTVENAKLLQYLWGGARYSTMPFVNLMGATEMLYLNMGKADADKWLKDTTEGVNFVREGWLTDEKRNPAAFRYYTAVELDGRLVTHAGLSYGEWVNIGRPQTARQAAYALNMKYLGTLYQPPCYRSGFGINYAASPIMGHSLAEVYSSWMSTVEQCPFPQIHGSLTMRDPSGHEIASTNYHPLYFAEKMNYHRWGTSITLNGTSFYAVDGPRKSLVKLDDYQAGYGVYKQSTHRRHAQAVYAPNVPTLISADGKTIL